jgi:hypothetical protein
MTLSKLFFAPPDDPYQAVEGRDAATVALKRVYEAEVEHKVASDYEHIVWAYGVIWALFCGYGVLLWRRSRRQALDLEALRRRTDTP